MMAENDLQLRASFGFTPVLLGLTLFAGCLQSPLQDGADRSDLRIEYAFAAAVTRNSAVITWKCSAPAPGSVAFGRGGLETMRVSPRAQEIHVMPLDGLEPETTYAFQAVCGQPGKKTLGFPSVFVTTDLNLAIRKRGIWIIGGITHAGAIVDQIDLFDPVSETWLAAVTRLPTPRAFPAIATLNGKVYVMGGIAGSPGTFAASTAVEEYDPPTDTWRTLASLPISLQGAIAGGLGDSVYVVSGTTTMDMTTGTLANQVYRLRPGSGATGTWTTLTSATAISARVDMSGCALSGALYYTGGRLAADGSAFGTSDAYVMGGNATTALVEAALTQARHGAAVACYRPQSTDPAASDPTAVLVAGGSTSTNTNQPASFISPSAVYDYYAYGTGTNTMQAGPTLPVAAYYTGMEISYDRRRAYVFGGATAINNPVATVYSLDLANPTAGSWASVPATMPVARYGHRAVIVNR